MKLKIMTRLGATCFSHILRGDEAKAWESEIKEIVKWFVASVPVNLRGHGDTRIVVERDSEQIFQFTMDYYKDKDYIEQEMERFEKSLADWWKVQFR